MELRKAVNYINPSATNKVTCINCQAVTTNDGRTVWVCEQCGTENSGAETSDVRDAQAAITDAAAAAGTPMEDVTATVAPPVSAPMAYVPETPAPIANSEPVIQPDAVAPDITSAVQTVQPDI